MLGKKLKKQFYKSKVESLKSTNAWKWWTGIKKFLGKNTYSVSYNNLADQYTDGDINNLANKKRYFFEDVNCNMSQLDKSSIPLSVG